MYNRLKVVEKSSDAPVPPVNKAGKPMPPAPPGVDVRPAVEMAHDIVAAVHRDAKRGKLRGGHRGTGGCGRAVAEFIPTGLPNLDRILGGRSDWPV